MEPQAWPMVCLNQIIGSEGPEREYGWRGVSSDWRLASQAGVRGRITSRAWIGVGIRERREGSERE